jgi:hypothetical protein
LMEPSITPMCEPATACSIFASLSTDAANEIITGLLERNTSTMLTSLPGRCGRPAHVLWTRPKGAGGLPGYRCRVSRQLRFEVLGPVRAWRDEADIELGTPQQRAILGILLLRNGAVATPDQLIAAIRGGSTPQHHPHLHLTPAGVPGSPGSTSPPCARLAVGRSGPHRSALRQRLGGPAWLVDSQGHLWAIAAQTTGIPDVPSDQLVQRMSANLGVPTVSVIADDWV